jgi:hypothetical protein
MDTRWTAHLGKQPIEKAEFASYIKASTPVLNRLIDILTKDIESSAREQKKSDLYDCPNWQLKQVDCNATQRTLEKIINLIKV